MGNSELRECVTRVVNLLTASSKEIRDGSVRLSVFHDMLIEDSSPLLMILPLLEVL